MVSSELVDEELSHVKKYHRISDFNLQNQNGENITHENYDNKIYVADFFFTTCPSICPIMTGNMIYLQNELEKENVMFASFTVTPEIDSVEVLKKYALDKGFKNTGSTQSSITFLNGEEGILRYRGYSIEDLAEKSSFLEVAFLLIYGDLPSKSELDFFVEEITQHSLVHEDVRSILDGFPSKAHPWMGNHLK